MTIGISSAPETKADVVGCPASQTIESRPTPNPPVTLFPCSLEEGSGTELTIARLLDDGLVGPGLNDGAWEIVGLPR